MVLQRRRPLLIWGTGQPGANVVATLGDLTSGSTRTDRDGNWVLRLDGQEAARGLTLTLSDGMESLEIHDVAIGEVWVGGGQSNMEFNLEFDADREQVFSGPMNPDIRFFDVPKLSYAGQENEHDYKLYGKWRTCTPEDLRYFSAVGYYFAEQLQNSLQVPVGIVGCNWGGTPACTWTDPEKLAEGPGSAWIEDYERGLRQFDPDQEAELFRVHKMSDRTDPFADAVLYRVMRDGMSEEEERELIPVFIANQMPTMGKLHPNRPGGLFATMVSRISRYPVQGVIWYQGESDKTHPDLYSAVLASMIDSWREAWETPDLPFLITQLAPFGGSPYGDANHVPVIREQQAKVAESVDQVWMASTSDVGAERDIHPKNKKPVGTRLALLAQRHVYGQTVAADAPALDSAKRTDTGVEITFHSVEELTWGGNPLPLEIRSPQGENIPVHEVAVSSNRLLLTAPVPPGSELSFAWTSYYQVDLCNEAGIPALPFKAQLP
ncbi:sialate O-acetylesterase [Pseudarthrobacter sp. TAF60_1]|uniref:sialate O-acetylesterase n=1 Tax=Pseudarthrobacter sp. TAF60_1 TaxID=3233071 RepID=UPI003F979756